MTDINIKCKYRSHLIHICVQPKEKAFVVVWEVSGTHLHRKGSTKSLEYLKEIKRAIDAEIRRLKGK